MENSAAAFYMEKIGRWQQKATALFQNAVKKRRQIQKSDGRKCRHSQKAENCDGKKCRQIPKVAANNAVIYQKWRQNLPSFHIIRGFRGFSPDQRHFDGDVTNAYLAVDPRSTKKNLSVSAAQFRVLPGIKKSSNLFYNHLIPQTKITQRTGKPTPRLSYK